MQVKVLKTLIKNDFLRPNYSSFIIGGDGNIYEGAGWHKIGAHTRGYNSRSLGIGFIGNFTGKVTF